MSNYWHQLVSIYKGKFSIQDGWLGLDYANLLDPLQAELTLFHENTHAALCTTTEFGQATSAFFKEIEFNLQIDDKSKARILSQIQELQFIVQEGLAVFMQISHLKNLQGKNKAYEWLESARFPQKYLEAFSILEFGLDLSSRYRDYFTTRVSHLAMMTNIRRDTVELDLLSSPTALINYLNASENNPNARLKEICERLKYKKWIVTKSEEEIARHVGIRYFNPPTKEEVANFLNYLLEKSGKEKIFTAAHIGSSPQGKDFFSKIAENMIIANMNLNFVERAIPVWNPEDFIFHCEDAEAIFINPLKELTKNDEIIRTFLVEKDAAVALTGFLRTGEIYMTYLSERTVERILTNELKNATLITKWGGFDQVQKSYTWTTNKKIRYPDVLIYNNPNVLLETLTYIKTSSPDFSFKYLHAGFTQGHPFQSLVIVSETELPINFVNAYGNKAIKKIIDEISLHSTKISNASLRTLAKHLNNTLSIWMGLPWGIDWIETMINKQEVIYRK